MLRSLTTPAKPKDKDYDALVDLLRQYFSQKPSVITEYFRFLKSDQQTGESVSAVIADLKKLSENCKFDASLTQ